jgi:hypothetical protein
VSNRQGKFEAKYFLSPVESVEALPEARRIQDKYNSGFSSSETATSSCRFSERKVVERIFFARQ